MGWTWGNRLSMNKLMYAKIESGITSTRDTEDVFNNFAVGLDTGVWRLVSGNERVRSTVVAGAIGWVMVGVVKQALKRTLRAYVKKLLCVRYQISKSQLLLFYCWLLSILRWLYCFGDRLCWLLYENILHLQN